VAAVMVAINQQLEAKGAGYAVRQADVSLTASADPNMARTVFADDRTHRWATSSFRAIHGGAPWGQ
jgi:hypothetical protein